MVYVPIASFLVALVVGLTGVGAGAIMTPVLVLMFNVDPFIAVATDLFLAAITKSSGALVHWQGRNVNWPAVRAMWRGSIPGVGLGVAVLVLFGPLFKQGLTFLLILVLTYTSYSLLRGSPILATSEPRKKDSIWATVFLGFSVATTSVGAGALGMVFLRRRLGDSNPRTLIGSDIAHAIPISFLAGAVYAFNGIVDFTLLSNLLMGSIPGVILGSLLSRKFRINSLRIVVALVIAVSALVLALKSLNLME